ncbi:hypothetical protein ACS0TY_005517 [Phlomoides rotata]
MTMCIDMNIPRRLEQDHWRWKHSANGCFSTKSAYQQYDEGQEMDPVDETRNQAISRLWGCYSPRRYQTIIWKLLHERLPTRDKLKLIGVIPETEVARCSWGCSEDEDAAHLFFTYQFAWKIWQKIYIWLGTDMVMHQQPSINLLLHGETLGNRKLAQIAQRFGSRLPGLATLDTRLDILNDVNGIIKPGRLTLLLGPPGCGKTTLLKALSGNLDKSLLQAKYCFDPLVEQNRLREISAQKSSAYTSQDDVHIPKMTVRETLDFSARCQGTGSRAEIMREVSKREKEANIVPDPDIDTYMNAISVQGQKTSLQTDYILKILGLDVCADTPFGDAMTRGVSSGQKKRLTIDRMVLPFGPLSIVFQDVQYYVETPMAMKEHGFTEKRIQLLRDITAAFRPGVLTALMGVSGAGKTTLLDVLSSRKTSGTIEGEIRIGGFPKVQTTFARISGYCEQTHIHSQQITVQESVLFSAWLRLDPHIESTTKYEFVKQVLERIELDNIKDALVGLPGVDGLSTEQRKRLTIAVELVSNPSIIFMDEPTTGLDSRAAAVVLRAVKNVANTGRTIVCTIHQPSIDIFEAFDEVM